MTVGDTVSATSDRQGSEGLTAMPSGKQKEEFRRLLREARERSHRSQRGIATALGVSHTAVSQWEAGRAVPVPATVPELERELSLDPGALSRLLGYLPIASGDDKASLDVIEAIRRDVRLGEHGQELLITMYRQLLRQHEQAIAVE